MIMRRVWAMPNKNTFDIKPIREFVWKYLQMAKVSIDPFARDKRWATYTNDLNPNTKAEYHVEAEEFLRMLLEQGVKADLIIFDPPYSLNQVKEVYERFGEKTFTQKHAQNVGHWAIEKRLCNKLLKPGGYFLHFGWHTNGLGKKYNCEIEEILIVAHGRAHNDTICMAEKKISEAGRMPADTKLRQLTLFGQ